jgi:hypothetical protein
MFAQRTLRLTNNYHQGIVYYLHKLSHPIGAV